MQSLRTSVSAIVVTQTHFQGKNHCVLHLRSGVGIRACLACLVGGFRGCLNLLRSKVGHVQPKIDQKHGSLVTNDGYPGFRTENRGFPTKNDGAYTNRGRSVQAQTLHKLRLLDAICVHNTDSLCAKTEQISVKDRPIMMGFKEMTVKTWFRA